MLLNTSNKYKMENNQVALSNLITILKDLSHRSFR